MLQGLAFRADRVDAKTRQAVADAACARTVEAISVSPAPWHSTTNCANGTDVALSAIPLHPLPIATRSAASARFAMSQRGQAGATARNSSSVPASNDETAIRPSSGSRAAASADATASTAGSLSSTSMKHPAGTIREHVGKARNAEPRQIRSRQIARRRCVALHPIKRRIVQNDRLTVGRHSDVQLNTVASRQRDGSYKGRHRVLRNQPVVAAMREQQRHRQRGAHAGACGT